MYLLKHHTGQMEGTFPFLRDIAWRVQGTCSNSGDRSTANYLLNNTGTRELHTSASLGYDHGRLRIEGFYSRFYNRMGVMLSAQMGSEDLLAERIRLGRPRGVTAGWTTNEITITADAVLNFETFKCAIKDTDTSAGNASANKVVCDIISFTDMSDPITVDLVSQKGFTIKNNGNDVDAKAVLYRGGEEIDTGGTAYTYTWKLWNSAGTSVVKTYTGKSITVSKADVTGKGVLMCEVSK